MNDLTFGDFQQRVFQIISVFGADASEKDFSDILREIYNSTELQSIVYNLKHKKIRQHALRQSAQVLDAIGKGYTTMSQIIGFTGMNITTLRRIVTRLTSDGRIKQTRIKNYGTQPILKFILVN